MSNMMKRFNSSSSSNRWCNCWIIIAIVGIICTSTTVDAFTTRPTILRISSPLSNINNNNIEGQPSSLSRTTTTCSTRRTVCWGKKPLNKKKKKTVGGGKTFSTAFGGMKEKRKNLDKEGPSPPSWIRTFPFAGSIKPGIIAEQKSISKEEYPLIVQPDYAQTSIPKQSRPMLPWVIEVKTPEQIELMRAAGALARRVLDQAGTLVREGTTTHEIDELVHQMTIDAGAYPSPLNYHGFPKSCCTSVNEVICHGIPDNRRLEVGDIINIDITVYLNGYHGDCSEMFVVPPNNIEEDAAEAMVDPSTKQLIQTTYDCWIKACNMVQPGNFYKDIGGIIEEYVTPKGYSTVRNFCGHGVGSVFHTNPSILHYKNNEPNGQMDAGHTFTIEPMICEGTAKALIWPDNWTATTVDGKRSAQFEHTLLITSDGVEALTHKTIDSPLQFWERESTIHQGFWLGTSANAKKEQELINAQKLSSTSS